MSKKAERLARLRYSEATDTFYIEIWSEEYQEWSLDMSQKCLRAEGAPPDEEPALVHFSMLKELANLAERGWKIHFTDKGNVLMPMPGSEKLADYKKEVLG